VAEWLKRRAVRQGRLRVDLPIPSPGWTSPSCARNPYAGDTDTTCGMVHLAWGLGFGCFEGLGLFLRSGVWGLGFWGLGSGFEAWGLDLGVWGLGFGVWNLRFQVWGSGLGVSGVGYTAHSPSFIVMSVSSRPSHVCPYLQKSIPTQIRQLILITDIKKKLTVLYGD